MTKRKVRVATLQTAFENPSFSNAEVANKYAKINKLDISNAQDAFELQRAIKSRNVPTTNAIRREMAQIAWDMLKDAKKGSEHLPLKLGGANITMTVEEFKTQGRTVTFMGDAFDVMFSALRGLRGRLVVEEPLTEFDGYFSLKLVVWYLTQVAVDKHLVGSVGMYVLWLLTNASPYYCRSPSSK